MVRVPLLRLVVFCCLCAVGHDRRVDAQVTWDINNTSNIGGNAVVTVVGSPTIVNTPFGNALRFDGNDGIIVDANPIAGAATFTIEMLFRPEPIVSATSDQPRILHVQSSIPPDHRATLEARITGDQWYLDAFLRSQRPGQSNPSVVNSLPLIDDTKLHPLSQWYNFAMTYDGEKLSAYLNGDLELEGDLSVLATADGQVSLGMRYNQVNFFEGVIAKVRFTPDVVDPADFLSPFVAGDYDRNGAVEAADYDLWHATFGSVVASVGAGADGNRDGIVDAADYTVWRDALPDGANLDGNSFAVPESGTLVWHLALLVAAFILSQRTQLMNVDYSAFEGWEIEGRPSAVTVRGKVQVRDGKFVGELGHSQLLFREPSHF